MKGVSTCTRCGFQWVRSPEEAKYARTCADCVTVSLRRERVTPMPLLDPRQPLVTSLGVRAALYGAAVRHALGALRMGKVAEAERVLRNVA